MRHNHQHIVQPPLIIPLHDTLQMDVWVLVQATG